MHFVLARLSYGSTCIVTHSYKSFSKILKRTEADLIRTIYEKDGIYDNSRDALEFSAEYFEASVNEGENFGFLPLFLYLCTCKDYILL